jgi:hypothetical protein
MRLPVARDSTVLSLVTLNSHRRTQTYGDSRFGASIYPGVVLP